MAAGSNYHCIICLLDFGKLRLVHLAGGNEPHADALDALQLIYQHIMHQAATRDNLLQLAADMLRIVIDSNSMSLAPQLPCRRQACHAAADDADFLAGLSSWRSNLLVGRQPAQVANLDRLVDTATGTAIHTWIRADTAADRTRERSILQLQVNSFLQLALTDEVITLLGRNAGRAAELARSVVLGIVPAWHTQSIKAVGNSIVNGKIIHGNIAENAALYPLIVAEILHGNLAAWLGSLFLKGKRTQLLPLAPVGKLSLQLGALDFLQELIHAASQKVNILLLQIQVADIGRIAADRAADINHAAYHAHAGTLTQHGGKLLAVIAADNGTAAAHELKGERAGIFQNPQLRLLIERVMLHQRTAAGTGTATDKDLAPGRAVTGSITGITADGNHTAGIQPAHISRGGILHKNLGIRQAHGAYALTGIGHMENQLLAISIPQRAADVVLAGGMDIELSLAGADSSLNCQQQILGGHTIMSLNSIYLKHSVFPPLSAYILDAQLVSNSLVSRNQSIAAANRNRAVADRSHEFLQLGVKCQYIINNLLCALVNIQTLNQARVLSADTHRALAGVAGVAAALLVAHTAQKLDEHLAHENAVGAKAHHLEGISSRVAGHADTAAAVERNLSLQALLNSSQIAVTDFGNNRMTGMVEGNLVGSTGTALNAIDEEAAANLVRIAEQVVVHGYGSRRSRALDGNRHTEAESRIQGEVHLLHGLLDGVQALMVWR